MTSSSPPWLVETRFEGGKTVLWLPVPSMGLMAKHLAKHAEALILRPGTEGNPPDLPKDAGTSLLVYDMAGKRPLRGSDWVRPGDAVTLVRKYTPVSFSSRFEATEEASPSPQHPVVPESKVSAVKLPYQPEAVDHVWIETVVTAPGGTGFAAVAFVEPGTTSVSTQCVSYFHYEAVATSAECELRAFLDALGGLGRIPGALHVYQASTLLGCLLHKYRGSVVVDSELATRVCTLTAPCYTIAFHYQRMPWLLRWAVRQYRKRAQ